MPPGLLPARPPGCQGSPVHGPRRSLGILRQEYRTPPCHRNRNVGVHPHLPSRSPLPIDIRLSRKSSLEYFYYRSLPLLAVPMQPPLTPRAPHVTPLFAIYYNLSRPSIATACRALTCCLYGVSSLSPCVPLPPKNSRSDW